MKIKRKIPSKTIYRVPKPAPQSEDYVEFNPFDHFEDSSISKIYIRKSFVIDIMDWVIESKTQSPVPEVGGFILGNCWGDEVVDYEISLEQFIPSKNIRANDPVRIDFGTGAMIELMEAQEKFRELKLVGWFHTHPGHKPYLSEQDLTIHENFFTENHQIAIVLDSLTEEYVSVLVCRKRNGKINKNYGEKYWFAWKNLLN